MARRSFCGKFSLRRPAANRKPPHGTWSGGARGKFEKISKDQMGKNSNFFPPIRFWLVFALNFQIAISFDPELGFSRSLYQWKVGEILYTIPGSILHFCLVWRYKIKKRLWREITGRSNASTNNFNAADSSPLLQPAILPGSAAFAIMR